MRGFAFLLLSFVAVACSTTQVIQPPSPPDGGKALVYFMRKSYPPYVRELRLKVDGTLAATIANNDLVAINLPIGTRTILLEATDGKPLSFEMRVERPERIYVVLTGDVMKTGQEFTGYKQFTVYLQWTLRAYRVSRKEAESIAAGFGRRIE